MALVYNRIKYFTWELNEFQTRWHLYILLKSVIMFDYAVFMPVVLRTSPCRKAGNDISRSTTDAHRYHLSSCTLPLFCAIFHFFFHYPIVLSFAVLHLLRVSVVVHTAKICSAILKRLYIFPTGNTISPFPLPYPQQPSFQLQHSPISHISDTFTTLEPTEDKNHNAMAMVLRLAGQIASELGQR